LAGQRISMEDSRGALLRNDMFILMSPRAPSLRQLYFVKLGKTPTVSSL
jgi:hypothetical protein